MGIILILAFSNYLYKNIIAPIYKKHKKHIGLIRKPKNRSAHGIFWLSLFLLKCANNSNVKIFTTSVLFDLQKSYIYQIISIFNQKDEFSLNFWQTSAKAKAKAEVVYIIMMCPVPCHAVPCRAAKSIHSLNQQSNFNQIFRVNPNNFQCKPKPKSPLRFVWAELSLLWK